MNSSYVSAVAERQAAFNESVKKGTLKNWAGHVRDRYAWPVGKDTLGIARFEALEPASINEAEGSAVAVITTADEDRDGDVVHPSGCQYGNFARNPVWFWGHQSWEVPIGTSKSPQTGLICVFPEENQVKAKCFFDLADPDADFIYGKVKRGYVNAVSIAFVPLEAYRREREEKGNPRNHPLMTSGWYYRLWDLTEVSWVGVPANAGAIRDALDHEKSFISPKLHKAMEPFAACANGACFNGWCPPCEVKKSACCDKCKAGKPCCNSHKHEQKGLFRVTYGWTETTTRGPQAQTSVKRIEAADAKEAAEKVKTWGFGYYKPKDKFWVDDKNVVQVKAAKVYTQGTIGLPSSTTDFEPGMTVTASRWIPFAIENPKFRGQPFARTGDRLLLVSVDGPMLMVKRPDGEKRQVTSGDVRHKSHNGSNKMSAKKKTPAKKAPSKRPVAKRKPAPRKKDLSGLNGTAGGYTEAPAEPFAGEETPAEEALEHEELAAGAGPVKCPACEFTTADDSMRFCPHCGMGLVPEAPVEASLDEEDLISKDEGPPEEEEETEEEFPMKRKKALESETGGEVSGADIHEGEETKDLSDQPKHSAQVLAHAHNHMQNLKDYLDQETSRMDHNEVAEALTKHKDESIPEHQEYFKGLMEEHHPDQNIETLSKELSGSGGEDTAVGEHDVPPEDETTEEPAPEEGAEDVEVEGEDELPGEDVEDEPVERGLDSEEANPGKPEDGEDVSETPTEELLERYRQPKSWRKSGKFYVVKFADGSKRTCKSKAEATRIMKGIIAVRKDCGGMMKDMEETGGLNPDHLAVIKEAKEHLEEMSNDPSQPSLHKAAHGFHAGRLHGVVKDLEEVQDADPEAPGTDLEGEDASPGPDVEDHPVERSVGEEDEEEGVMVTKGDDEDEYSTLLKSLNGQLNRLPDLLFKSTGRKVGSSN